jgi:HTH-type transcriptional regulator / antitoxin HigA
MTHKEYDRKDWAGGVMSNVMAKRKASSRNLPETFGGLVGLMVPHVIEDEADFEEVGEMLNRLVLMRKRTPDQQKYMDIIELTITAYDEKHPIDTSDISGLDVLKSILDEHKMTASDLGRLLGNRWLGSKILSGERELSKTHMKMLGEHFKLAPGVFL